MTNVAHILAQLPEPGGFVSPVKVGVLFGAFLAWLHACQWVARDTRAIRLQWPEFWHGAVLTGGALGVLAWLFLPWRGGLFAVGGLVWFVLAGGTAIAYVIYRNGRVIENAKVLTVGHIKRLMAGRKGKGGSGIDERVKLKDADGSSVRIPEEPEEIAEFALAQDFLFDALWRRATEVNLTVQGDRTRLAYRVDGAVAEREPLEREQADRLLRFMRRIAGQDPEEHRRPQTGKIEARMPGGGSKSKVEISVRTEGSTAGERLYLRITTDETRFRLPDIGLTEPQMKQVQDLIAADSGLVIFSAPKRAGLTSTLYAALRWHDAFIQHLHTLERSPLMEIENVTQNVYNNEGGAGGFARQLGTILRREPDVVMVEACDDTETGTLVAREAAGGRKIYLGMVADDTFAALKGFLGFCDNRTVAADALRAVVCQRLVRKLCPACKQAYRPDPNVLRKANLPVSKDQMFFQPPREPELDKKGNPIICPSCQGASYLGRTGVFELLIVDDVIREMIKGNASIRDIRDHARKNQMRYVWEEGLEKVKEGVTGMNEILRVLKPAAKK